MVGGVTMPLMVVASEEAMMDCRAPRHGRSRSRGYLSIYERPMAVASDTHLKANIKSTEGSTLC